MYLMYGKYINPLETWGKAPDIQAACSGSPQDAQMPM